MSGASPEAADRERVRRVRASFWGAARVLRRDALRSVAGRASLALGLLFGLYAAVWLALGGVFARRALRDAGVMAALAATAPLALRLARGTTLVSARASGLEAAAAAHGTRGVAFAQAGFFGVLTAMWTNATLSLVPFLVVLGVSRHATPGRVVALALLCVPFGLVVSGLASLLASAARAAAHPRGGLALVTLFLASVVLAGLSGAAVLGVPGAVRAVWSVVVELALGSSS